MFTVDDNKLKALLVQRNQQPGQGKWSLPGSFVKINETLENAASRGLSIKTGVSGIFLEQLFTFGAINRDPRTRVITVAYYALVDVDKLHRQLIEDEQIRLVELEVPWKGETGGKVHALDESGKRLKLAFDHAEILGSAIKRLRGKLAYAPIGFELLPKRFTLRQLQNIHETILNKKKNKDSFRRKLAASGLISPTGELETAVGHRPAELYRFKSNKKPKVKMK